MADLTFAQPERRNLARPALIAAAVLIAVFAILYAVNPHQTAEIQVTRAVIYPAHLVYKAEKMQSGMHVVGRADAAEDDLYVLATIHIADKLGVPLFLKDFTATLTNPDGTVFQTSAVEQGDLKAVFAAFPAVGDLATRPLLRESSVAPKQSVDGMVLLQFPVPQAVWDQRKSATVTIDFYHQPSMTVEIPKQGQPSASTGVR